MSCSLQRIAVGIVFRECTTANVSPIVSLIFCGSVFAWDLDSADDVDVLTEVATDGDSIVDYSFCTNTHNPEHEFVCSGFGGTGSSIHCTDSSGCFHVELVKE